MEPPSREGGREGSHRSSDYRFPGGGPRRRGRRNGRRDGEPPMAQQRRWSGRQVRRYCLGEGGREGWREGKKDLGFAFLPWNEVNDAMRLLHTKEVQSLSKRLIPPVDVIPLASLPLSADASSRNLGQDFLIKSVADLEMV